jgi:hypothetical protein
MTSGKGITFVLALLVSSALTGPCLANTYNFSYSFTTGFNSITASGTLGVGAEDPMSGGFPILSITGTRNVNGTDMQITGLLPIFGLNSFDGNDNLLFFPGPPLLDFNGFSFSVDNPSLSDDGLGDVNVYFAGSGLYTEAANGVNPGSFEVSPAAGTASPEPSTTMLLICGLLGLAVRTRRWRRPGSAFAAGARRLSSFN